MTTTPTRILILGGGFAGIRVAHLLSKRRQDLPLEVTLMDRSPVYVHPPALTRVASAFAPWEREAVGTVPLEAAGIPYRDVLDGTIVGFVRAEVERIDPAARTVVTGGGRDLSADILVLALGAQAHRAGVPNVGRRAFGLRTFPEALAIRNHLVSQFLTYRHASRRAQERAFTVVVAGGGIAGVEAAAALMRFLKNLAALHRVDPGAVRVELHEAGDAILREVPPFLRQKGLQRLRGLGIHVHTRSRVRGVGAESVTLDGGMDVPAGSVVWLCGVRAHDVFLRSGLPIHPRGGLLVEGTLEVTGHANVFGAGDAVHVVDAETGRSEPDVAWAALQMGNVVAENIVRRVRGEPLVSYHPRPRPTFATVGGTYALVHLPPFAFSGSLGWVGKHVSDLVFLMHILPNTAAFRSWWKGLRARVVND